jgi:hypothetical protein
MKQDPEPIERLFEAARKVSIPRRAETPASLSQNILREIRLTNPDTLEKNTVQILDALSTASVSVGALIAIACMIAGRSEKSPSGAFDEPNLIASEFIQQSLEP